MPDRQVRREQLKDERAEPLPDREGTYNALREEAAAEAGAETEDKEATDD
jgi:hypothetical protein